MKNPLKIQTYTQWGFTIAGVIFIATVLSNYFWKLDLSRYYLGITLILVGVFVLFETMFGLFKAITYKHLTWKKIFFLVSSVLGILTIVSGILTFPTMISMPVFNSAWWVGSQIIFNLLTLLVLIILLFM